MKGFFRLKRIFNSIFKSKSLKRLFNNEFRPDLIDDYFVNSISSIKILEAGVGLDRFKFFNFYEKTKSYDFTFIESRKEKFEYWHKNISNEVRIIDTDINNLSLIEKYNLISLSFPTSQIKRFLSEVLPNLIINQRFQGFYLLTIPIGINQNYFDELLNNKKLGYKQFLEYMQINAGGAFKNYKLDLKKLFTNNIEIIAIYDPIYRPQQGYLYKSVLLKLKENYSYNFQNSFQNSNNNINKIYSEIINDNCLNTSTYQNDFLIKKFLSDSPNKNKFFLDAGVGLNRFKLINQISEFENINFDFLESRIDKHEYWNNKITSKIKIINNNVYNFKSNKKYDLVNLSFSPRYIDIFCKNLLKRYTNYLKSNSLLILTIPYTINYRLYEELRKTRSFGFEDFKRFLKNEDFTIYKNEFNFYTFIDELNLKIIQVYDPFYIPQRGYLYKTILLKKKVKKKDFSLIFNTKKFNKPFVLPFGYLIRKITFVVSIIFTSFIYLILVFKNNKLKIKFLREYLIYKYYLFINYLKNINILFESIKKIYIKLKENLESIQLKFCLRILEIYFSKFNSLKVLNAGVGLERYKYNILLKNLFISEYAFLEKRTSLYSYWSNKIDRKLNLISENILNFKSDNKYDIIYLSFLPRNIKYFFNYSINNYYNMMHKDSILVLTIPYKLYSSKFKKIDEQIYGKEDFIDFLNIKSSNKNSLNVLNLIDKNKFKFFLQIPNLYKPQDGFKYKTLILKINITKKKVISDEYSNNVFNKNIAIHTKDKTNIFIRDNKNTSNKLISTIKNIFNSELHNFEILDSGDSLERYKLINTFTNFKSFNIDLIEQNINRFNYWRKMIIADINLFSYNPSIFVTLKKYDIVSLSFKPQNIGLFFKKIIYDYLFTLKEKSILIITIPISIKYNPNNRSEDNKFSGFEEFSLSYTRFFDDNKKLIIHDFLKNLGFECFKIFDPIYEPYEGYEFKTILLIFNKKAKNELNINKKISNSFSKVYPINFLNKGSRFSLYNYCKFISKLKSQKPIANIDEFYKNIKLDATQKEPFQLLKHDIHSDVISALKMAKAENEIDVSSIYFAMHKSDHTKFLIDHSSYIDSLLKIQELGHEIGIHCDPIYLTVNGVKAVEEIVYFVNELRSQGLKIRLANTHGNTKHYFRFIGDTSNFSQYVKEGDNNFSKFQSGTDQDGYFCTSEMIFKEIYRNQDVVRDSNIETKSKGLVNSISLKKLMNEAGFDYWIDTSIYDKNLQKLNASTSISDTHKKIQLWGAYFITESKLFELDDESQNELLSQIKFDCAHLYHPQLYV